MWLKIACKLHREFHLLLFWTTYIRRVTEALSCSQLTLATAGINVRNVRFCKTWICWNRHFFMCIFIICCDKIVLKIYALVRLRHNSQVVSDRNTSCFVLKHLFGWKMSGCFLSSQIAGNCPKVSLKLSGGVTLTNWLKHSRELQSLVLQPSRLQLHHHHHLHLLIQNPGRKHVWDVMWHVLLKSQCGM